MDIVRKIVVDSWHFLLFVASALRANKCRQGAAALTYTTLFALVPMMTVSYVVLSMMPGLAGVGTEVEDFLFTHFLPDSSGQIQSYLGAFSQQAKNLTVPGVVILFFTALMMLKTIEATFNDIWGVEKSRKGVSSFLLYWGVLSLGPLLAGAGLMLSTYLMSVSILPDTQALETMKPLMRFVPFLLTTTALCLIYVAVPNTRVLVRHAIFGALVAGVCFELAKNLFAFVVSKTSIAVIYGAFASAPLFLIWVYLSWMIVLFGAVIVRSISIFRLSEGTQYADLFLAVIVLRRFYKAQKQGLALSTSKLIRGEGMNIGVLGVAQWQKLREVFETNHLIHCTAEGEYMLAKDLNHVSLFTVASWFGAAYTLLGKEPTNTLKEKKWFQQLLSMTNAIHGYSREQLDISLATLFESES